MSICTVSMCGYIYCVSVYMCTVHVCKYVHCVCGHVHCGGYVYCVSV